MNLFGCFVEETKAGTFVGQAVECAKRYSRRQCASTNAHLSMKNHLPASRIS